MKFLDMFSKKEKTHMILRPETPDVANQHSTSWIDLKWVSRELDENENPLTSRIPEPVRTTQSLKAGFSAAGRSYRSIRELAVAKKDGGPVCIDCYGREVFCFFERFPCFDSYDYLYEHRYIRRFLIREGDRLTLVYYEDENDSVNVTEDLKRVKVAWWKEMEPHWGV